MTRLGVLAVALGLLVALPQIYGLMNPQRFATEVRKFPRSPLWGYALMLLATAWFLYNVTQESIADFANYKTVLLGLFAAVGLGSCIFVRDFLAVRGLAVVLLLLGKLMVDTGRPRLADTSWVLVIQIWAYVLVMLGMWLTISPWRLRDVLIWATADQQRLKIGCSLRLAFGLFVAALGVTKF